MTLEATLGRLAGRLVDAATVSDTGMSWYRAPIEALGAAPAPDIGGSLYEGSAGIGWFLSQVDGYEDAGLAALQHSLHWWERTGPTNGLHGGSLAPLSIVAAAASAAGQANLADRATELGRQHLNALANDVDADVDAGCDVMSGLAGTLLATCPSRDPETPVNRLRARLIEAATEQPVGSAWPYLPPSQWGTEHRPLTGLAHGVVGVAAALAVSSGADPAASPMVEPAEEAGPSIASLIHEALLFEAQFFDRSSGQWSTVPTDRSTPATWCHGVVGGVAARLAIHRRCPSTRLEAEIGAGLAAMHSRAATALTLTALSSDQGSNLSLCHGLGGLIDVLLSASNQLGVAEHAQTAHELAEHVVSLLPAAGDWPCGTRDGREHPSLFIGLSGFGAVLLRLGDATRPSPTDPECFSPTSERLLLPPVGGCLVEERAGGLEP